MLHSILTPSSNEDGNGRPESIKPFHLGTLRHKTTTFFGAYFSNLRNRVPIHFSNIERGKESLRGTCSMNVGEHWEVDEQHAFLNPAKKEDPNRQKNGKQRQESNPRASEMEKQ